MTELADKLMQCYDSRELPSWYEIYDASTRLATLSRQLAEAQGVIERQRKGLEAAEQWLSGWASAEPYISAIRAALSPPQEQHPAANRGT